MVYSIKVGKKEDLYKWIKICGLISFIPFILAIGPLAGYAAGDYLKRRFGLNDTVVILFIAIGIIFGIRETVKIIRMLIRIDKS